MKHDFPSFYIVASFVIQNTRNMWRRHLSVNADAQC